MMGAHMRRMERVLVVALVASLGAETAAWAGEAALAQADVTERLKQEIARSPLSWALHDFSTESRNAFSAMVQLTGALIAHTGVQVEHYTAPTTDKGKPGEWRVFEGQGSDGLRFKFKLGHADHTSGNVQQSGRSVHYRAKLWLNGHTFSLRLDPKKAEPRAYAINGDRRLYSISDGYGPELVRSTTLILGRQSAYTNITTRPWFIQSAARLSHARALMPEHTDPSSYKQRVTRESYSANRRHKETRARDW